MIEGIAEVMDEFKREIMPRSNQLIKEHIATYSDDLKRQARTEYLKGQMEDTLFDTFYLLEDYDRLSSIDDAMNRIFIGQRITENVNHVITLQGEAISLRRPPKSGGITEDDISRAREYPYDQLVEVTRNRMAICPFHGDKDPSFSIRNNYGYCFGCHWKGDTIAFLMELEGLSFPEAVKRLQ